MQRYIINDQAAICTDDGKLSISPHSLTDAIRLANEKIHSIDSFTDQLDIDIFNILGLRNLSGFIGEIMVSSIEAMHKDEVVRNPHQDGYPDLMRINDDESRDWYRSIVTDQNGQVTVEKSLVSPFKYGGFEVKATCGLTPPAHKIPKPTIGEQRISLVQSFDWKAHHRDTNNLIGIFWDFIDGIPTVVAAFYRNDLTPDDWGKIVRPKEGGGRTTSVSIMNAKGIKKMCQNWIAIIEDKKYIDAFSQKKWIGKQLI